MAKCGIYRSLRAGWFKVVPSFYNADFIDDLKMVIPVSQRYYDRNEGCWFVHELHLEELVTLCNEYFDSVENDLIPKNESGNLWESVFAVIPSEYRSKVYMALAQAIHPDHGGSNEQMALLNQAYHQEIG